MKHELGFCLKTSLPCMVTTSGWIASSDLFNCRLTEWSTNLSVVAQGAPLKRLQSHGQSTASRLTLICDLTQWEANFLFVFFLLYSPRKRKTECCFCDDGRQWVEEPPTLWYQMLGTRPSMRKQEQHSVWRRTCVWEKSKIRTHREKRGRHKETLLFLKATVTKDNNNL